MVSVSAVASHLASRLDMPDLSMRRRVSSLAQAGLILPPHEPATPRDAAALLIVGLASTSLGDAAEVLRAYEAAPATSTSLRRRADSKSIIEVVLPVKPGEQRPDEVTEFMCESLVTALTCLIQYAPEAIGEIRVSCGAANPSAVLTLPRTDGADSQFRYGAPALAPAITDPVVMRLYAVANVAIIEDLSRLVLGNQEPRPASAAQSQSQYMN